jgi:hypothetical protein
MAHLIEFVTDWWVYLECPSRERPGLVMLRRGQRRRAVLRPRIHEGRRGPIEVADLHFEDGGTAWGVPFACFAFAE